MSFRLPAGLHDRLRLQSYLTGTAMNEILIAALEKQLPSRETLAETITLQAKAGYAGARGGADDHA